MVSKEISESFPDVNKAHELIPSYDYLLKQFTPKNQYCIKSDRYFSKLPFQLTLSGRFNHIDFEYTQTVKKYMKEFAVLDSEISVFIQVDDKNKVSHVNILRMYFYSTLI